MSLDQLLAGNRTWWVEHGDCLDVLRRVPDESIDSIVTDPPAGIAFMNREWDDFRRSRNESDTGRDNVFSFSRTSQHGPEYGRGERGKFIAFLTTVMGECYRVLKPGGHAFVWAIPRTSHWTGMAIENAGFQIRDRVSHIFSQGFPKSADVSKAIDKETGEKGTFSGVRAGHEGFKNRTDQHSSGSRKPGWDRPWKNDPNAVKREHQMYIPATEQATRWQGWGTALKPAVEDWWLARKPLSEKTVAMNVLKHGTGALNIDESRVDIEEITTTNTAFLRYGGENSRPWHDNYRPSMTTHDGRWPPRLLLSHSPECRKIGTKQVKGNPSSVYWTRSGQSSWLGETENQEKAGYADVDGMETVEDWQCVDGCPILELDRQSGERPTSQPGTVIKKKTGSGYRRNVFGAESRPAGDVSIAYGDTGTASRFFPQFAPDHLDDIVPFRYEPKASRGERDFGLDDQPSTTFNRVNPGGLENDPRWGPTQVKNNHPTVKSVTLMQWLIRLITPPGGLVCDPFTGSGTTGVAATRGGWRFLGIEQDAVYCDLACRRIEGDAPMFNKENGE